MNLDRVIVMIGRVFIITLILLLIPPIIYRIKYKTYYEYVDLDGNVGIADYCSEGYKSVPHCQAGGTTIVVKQFTQIIEKR